MLLDRKLFRKIWLHHIEIKEQVSEIIKERSGPAETVSPCFLLADDINTGVLLC